ncbi:hypothetical protein ANN_00864 [Periplaneta americana]|uniref:Uncharacterized protein n=1 Tax=Periplaneta americana TaxID=6978 RepID=A0ABQ8TUZ2_PERAM|nr:hypothetical protein ANN_00864 [Periplaneta americana]
MTDYTPPQSDQEQEEYSDIQNNIVVIGRAVNSRKGSGRKRIQRNKAQTYRRMSAKEKKEKSVLHDEKWKNTVDDAGVDCEGKEKKKKTREQWMDGVRSMTRRDLTENDAEDRDLFNINRNDSVPVRDTILCWVNNLLTKGAILKNKPPGPQRRVRTPGNVERVRQAILRSPGRSARRYSAALGISIRTACVYEDKPRILDELKDAIRQHITQINRDLLERIEVNFRQQLQQCVNTDGHHMPHVIFRS